MEIQKRTEDGIAYLRPRTDCLDSSSCLRLKDELQAQVAAGATFLAVDLQDVGFMDSSGLAALISGLRALEGRGELAICGAHDGVLGLLKLSGMTRVFPLFETESALRASHLGRAR